MIAERDGGSNPSGVTVIGVEQGDIGVRILEKRGEQSRVSVM